MNSLYKVEVIKLFNSIISKSLHNSSVAQIITTLLPILFMLNQSILHEIQFLNNITVILTMYRELKLNVVRLK